MNNRGINEYAKFYIGEIKLNNYTFMQFFSLIFYGGHFSDEDRSKIVMKVVKAFPKEWSRG